ncbi:MAG: hypothetical protein RLN75_04615 [Longimicrobiales bacterium]
MLVGDTAREELHDRYCTMIERLHAARRNIVVVRDVEGRGFGERRRVDIWWDGRAHDHRGAPRAGSRPHPLAV